MIEIKFSWKTYRELIPRYTASDIQNWIERWYLEEVKENKDSIFEKLREALWKEAEQYEDNEPCFARDMLDLLTSLQPPAVKEEPLPQEDIELLPGWELDREWFSDSDLIDCMNKQLVDVTNRLNQLIQANNK